MSDRARRCVSSKTAVNSSVIYAELIGSDTVIAEGKTMRCKSPITALCRQLIKAGYDPAQAIEAYRGDVMCIRVRSIGDGAQWIARENSRSGPFFARWVPCDPNGYLPHNGRSPVAKSSRPLPA